MNEQADGFNDISNNVSNEVSEVKATKKKRARLKCQSCRSEQCANGLKHGHLKCPHHNVVTCTHRDCSATRNTRTCKVNGCGNPNTCPGRNNCTICPSHDDRTCEARRCSNRKRAKMNGNDIS